jgi:hypothetical protein
MPRAMKKGVIWDVIGSLANFSLARIWSQASLSMAKLMQFAGVWLGG